MALPLIPILAGAAIGGATMLFGGGKKEGTVTTNSTTNTNTTSNQNTYNYNVTTDNSFNVVSNSPFASLKKGDLGTLGGSPGMNVIPSVVTDQTPKLDQSSQTDMTGLLVFGGLAVFGFFVYKELTT